MCGIVGFAGGSDRADLERMMGLLAHRGPDGRGIHIEAEGGVHLGHLRLAIVDLEGGAQPMWTADGRYAIVFNGEIYNAPELRRELEARGRIFRTTHSDTEALLEGFAEWGEDLPIRLNGMFAFCIYDRERQRLFLARDRFGEKPLYYASIGGVFGFASEVSALVSHRAIPATIRPMSVQKLMAYGFLPAPLTLYEGCRKLPPGGQVSVDLRTGEVRESRYWRFELDPNPDWEHRPEGDLLDELEALLETAVRRRLVSDVPLGLFLSGGIDSSLILAMASRAHGAESLPSFTIGFSEASFDESAYAATVARAFGCANHVRTIDLDAARTLVPEILGRLDEPFADASIVPTYLVAQLARERVTVALSGDGGDELFAGYDPFVALAPADFYASVTPKPVHAALRALAGMLPISTANMSLDFKLRRTLLGLSYPRSMWNPVWLGPLDPARFRDVFDDPARPEDLFSEAIEDWDAMGSASIVERTLSFYTRFYLPETILMKVDRATMMNSLESRAPFLDNDLSDFARRLPSSWKFRGGTTKYLLRKAAERRVSAAIAQRPKKGFGLPTARWLRTIPTTPPLDPVGGVRLGGVSEAWAAHRSGARDDRLFLWTWMSLQATQAARAHAVS